MWQKFYASRQCTWRNHPLLSRLGNLTPTIYIISLCFEHVSTIGVHYVDIWLPKKKKKGSEEEEERKIDWCGDQFQLTSIVHLNHLCCINEDRALIMILHYNFNGFGWGKQLKFKSVNGLMLFKVDHWLPLLDIESVEHKLMEIAWHCCVCKLHEMNATYVSHGLIFKGLIAWTSIKTLGRPSWETSFNHLDVDFSVPSHLQGEHNLNRWI